MSLLSLPLELRFQIYRHSLLPHSHTLPGTQDQLLSSTAYGFPVSILLLNKQIHAEAKEVFYRENVFSIEVDYTLPCVQAGRAEEMRGQILSLRGQEEEQQSLQMVPAPQCLPMFKYITHIRLLIDLHIPLIDLAHHGFQNDYYLRRLVANMASICSVLALSPTIKSVTLVFPEPKRSDERLRGRWRVKRTERMGGRETRRAGLSLGFLVGRVQEQMLGEAVGRVLGGLGVLPPGVKVVMRWEEGQEAIRGRGLDGLRAIVEGFLVERSERRVRCRAGDGVDAKGEGGVDNESSELVERLGGEEEKGK